MTSEPASPPSAAAGPVLVVVGPPGVGKTTVGRLVAQALGVGLRDTDHDIEVDTGESVSDLFVTRGEAVFRALEKSAVAAALREHDGVLTLGGGAVMDPDTRDALRGRTVVFLDVALPDAMRRLGLTQSRPLLLGDETTVRQQWRALLEQRRPWYDEVATLRVDTSGRTPEQVAAEVTASVLALQEGAR
jgi:shikimate kinase